MLWALDKGPPYMTSLAGVNISLRILNHSPAISRYANLFPNIIFKNNLPIQHIFSLNIILKMQLFSKNATRNAIIASYHQSSKTLPQKSLLSEIIPQIFLANNEKYFPLHRTKRPTKLEILGSTCISPSSNCRGVVVRSISVPTLSPKFKEGDSRVSRPHLHILANKYYIQWCAIEMQHLLYKSYVNEVTLGKTYN